MANPADIAAYILKKLGPMTAMKLQKLVYYSQAWSLVWNEKPLFSHRIEAWKNGPVIPSLYRLHRGQYEVKEIPEGKPTALSAEQKDTVNRVLKFYGNKTAQWLSDLTHEEKPWKRARKGVAEGDVCGEEITQASMEAYYSSLR